MSFLPFGQIEQKEGPLQIRHAAEDVVGLVQIIHEADKIYGVSHSNRISHIDVVSREDALEFVQANLQEEGHQRGIENEDPN